MRVDNPDEILEWGILRLWNAVQQIDEEENNTQISKQINQIRNGENLPIHKRTGIQIPIYYLTQEYYDIYPCGGSVNVYNFGKIELETFMEDTQTRERLMRKIIYDHIDDPDVTQSR